MSKATPTALIADDEPLLRQSLTRMLAQAWPELEIAAQARNGRDAVEQFEALQPDICFLDIHMPGISGIEAARLIGQRAHIVFVTAYDRYAVQAFEQGALDYLVKPLEATRVASTVARLRERVDAGRSTTDSDALLERLLERLRPAGQPQALRWLRASVASTVRLIAVDDIDYLRSDDKYTRIAWRDDAGKPGEALIRTPLKELLTQLDGERFVQVHRSVVVNLHAIREVVRADNDTATIHLKGRDEVLPVSRGYLHQFRQM